MQNGSKFDDGDRLSLTSVIIGVKAELAAVERLLAEKTLAPDLAYNAIATRHLLSNTVEHLNEADHLMETAKVWIQKTRAS